MNLSFFHEEHAAGIDLRTAKWALRFGVHFDPKVLTSPLAYHRHDWDGYLNLRVDIFGLTFRRLSKFSTVYPAS